MNALFRLWRGEVPLPDAFWTWAVVGGIVVNAVTSGLFLVLIMSGWPVAALVVGYALSLPYNLFVSVAVWRAADRYEGERRWADLARIAVVIGMVLLSMT